MTTPTPADWNRQFCRRVAALRDARGWTQEQMAEMLGIPLERYKKYEQRSPMKTHLLARFALLVGRTVDEILAVDRPLTKRRPANERDRSTAAASS